MKTKWLLLLFLSITSTILPMEKSVQAESIEGNQEEKSLQVPELPNEIWTKILLHFYNLYFDPNIIDEAKDIYQAIKIIEKHIKKCCFSIPFVCKRFKDLYIPKEIRKLYIPYLNEKFLEQKEEGFFPKNCEWDGSQRRNKNIAQFIAFRILADTTLLAIILTNPNLNLLNLLLFYGVDVNKRGQYDGKTLLHDFVCFHGDKKDFISLLLLYNADPNIQDKWGDTPLSSALSIYDIEETIIELLLKSGTNPNIQNAKGESALFITASNKPRLKAKIIMLLLRHGANPNLKNEKDINAFDAARLMRNSKDFGRLVTFFSKFQQKNLLTY